MSRTSFSGIFNSPHCGGTLGFCHDSCCFVTLLAFIVQSEKTCSCISS